VTSFLGELVDGADRGPAKLDVRRNPTSHLAFGHGQHGCPGQLLARLEIGVALPAPLRRSPSLRLDADHDDLGWRWNASVFGVHSLPVAW
jgi:cytochrome P450